MTRRVTAGLTVGLMLAIPLLAAPTARAGEWDVGGFARTVAVLAPIRSVTGEPIDRGIDGSLRHRLMVTGDWDDIGVEGHFVVGGLFAALDDTERTVVIPAIGTAELLRWPGLAAGRRFSGSGRAGVTADIDRLVLTAHHGSFDLAVGRQPINLASTLIFTPHDVFAPFSPLDFFRAYKPGVDAIRLDYETLWEDAPVTSLRASVIAAAGFAPTKLPQFDAPLDLDRSALLGRIALSFDLGDVIVIGGHAPRRWMVGLGAQLDFAGWLFRLEHVTQRPANGHFGFDGHIVVAGFMHQVTPDISFVFEGMVKRGDYVNITTLGDLLALPSVDPWGANGLDRWIADQTKLTTQAAASMTWQAHPLVGLQTLVWYSPTANDDVVVLGNYTTYSVSDEGVAAAGFGVDVLDPETYFVNAEFRWTW